MIQTLTEHVSVVSVFNADTGATAPYRIKWRGSEYVVAEIGFAHSFRHGRTIVHVFEVNVGSLDFRLELDGETLHWTLKAVSDGLAD